MKVNEQELHRIILEVIDQVLTEGAALTVADLIRPAAIDMTGGGLAYEAYKLLNQIKKFGITQEGDRCIDWVNHQAKKRGWDMNKLSPPEAANYLKLHKYCKRKRSKKHQDYLRSLKKKRGASTSLRTPSRHIVGTVKGGRTDRYLASMGGGAVRRLVKEVLSEVLGGGLRSYERYLDIRTKADAGPARVKELIKLAATDREVRIKLAKYMDGQDQMRVRALRKKLGLFLKNTQGPEDLPKGRPELKALQGIEQDPGRVSATQRGAREDGESRAYGVSSSPSPIRRSVHDPRQEKELEKIDVGTAPLGLIPGFGLASSSARAIAPTASALVASEGGKELAKQLIKGLSLQAISKGAGIPTSTKSLARKIIKKSIDPEFHEGVKNVIAYVQQIGDQKKPAGSEKIALNLATASRVDRRMMEENKMKIAKQELHQLIKEELSEILKELTRPQEINWELVGKNYLKALYHKGGGIGYEEAKQKVKQEVKAARRQPGGLEALTQKVKSELDIDITASNLPTS